MAVIQRPLRFSCRLPLRTLNALRNFTSSSQAFFDHETPKAPLEKPVTNPTAAIKTSPKKTEEQAATQKTKRKRRPAGTKVKTWSPAEKSLLLKLREGRLGWSQISKHFPDRTIPAVKAKYSQIAPRGEGGRLIHSTRFNDAERALLVKLRGDGMCWKEIQRLHLPDRNIQLMINCFNSTRVAGQDSDTWTYQAWSESEKQKLLFLREERKSDFAELANLLGRTKSSVRNRYSQLVQERARMLGGSDKKTGYVGVRSRKNWTKEDEKALEGMLMNGTAMSVIRKAFPQWTRQGLTQKVHRVRMKHGLLKRRRSRVTKEVLTKMMKLKAKGASIRSIAAMMPEFEYGELQYAYYCTSPKVREAAGIKPGSHRAPRVHGESMVKLLEMRAKKMSWREIVDQMPGFQMAELKDACYKATTRKRMAEAAEKKDGTGGEEAEK